MVSGWDKSPGPENDYTPRPSRRVMVGVVVLVAALIAIYAWVRS